MSSEIKRITKDQHPTRSFLLIGGTDVTGRKKPTNYIETVANFLKGMIGTGIFALGWAFLHSGMLLGPILMIIIALINLYCQHILIRACAKVAEKESRTVLPTFSETVQYTFEDSSLPWLQKQSYSFGIVTDVFLLLGQYGLCIVYLTFIARHLGEIAAAHEWKQDYRVMLAIILIPMWLSTFLGNMKLLAPLSIIANIIIWSGIILILYYACQELPPISERHLIAHIDQLPLFFGIVFFGFGGITFVIPLRTEMAKPEQATSTFGVLNVSMIVCIVLYGLVGVFAYWKWGEDVEGSAFLNLPEKEILSQVSKILISFGVMVSYTLHMYVAFEIVYPRFHKMFGPFIYPELVRIIFKSVAVFMTYCFANLTPNLAVHISLVGALSLAALSILFPAMLDLVMLYDELTTYIILKNVTLIIIAITGSMTGVVISIMEMINEHTHNDIGIEFHTK